MDLWNHAEVHSPNQSRAYCSGRPIRGRQAKIGVPFPVLRASDSRLHRLSDFSLIDEQFAKQQRGEAADPEAGGAVAVFGTLGYCGACVGALAAGVR